LNEPLANGPIVSAAVKMKPPMAIGARMPYQGARLSVATALISITNRNVPTASMMNALPAGVSPGELPSAFCTFSECSVEASPAATVPPMNWASQ
jgi:hypothetical protein